MYENVEFPRDSTVEHLKTGAFDFDKKIKEKRFPQ